MVEGEDTPICTVQCKPLAERVALASHSQADCKESIGAQLKKLVYLYCPVQPTRRASGSCVSLTDGLQRGHWGATQKVGSWRCACRETKAHTGRHSLESLGPAKTRAPPECDPPTSCFQEVGLLYTLRSPCLFSRRLLSETKKLPRESSWKLLRVT